MADFTGNTVSRILAGFNFERVHLMMVAVDWKWSVSSGPDGFRVPTVAELRSQAERLLYAAVQNRDSISTGGLKARYFDVHGRARLALTFEAAEYWADYGA